MPQTLRTILCPVDFDEDSLRALQTAGELARLLGATVFASHVLTPVGADMTADRVDACVAEQENVRERLLGLCHDRLGGVRYEVLTRTGDPAVAIIHVAEELKADLVVIATHASHRKPRAFPGSVAEHVLRESICPVMTVRPSAAGYPDAVGRHMTTAPITITPATPVARVRQLMEQHRLRSFPVLEDDKVAGIVTDRDLATSDATDDTTIGLLMTRDVVVVLPTASVQEAARLLLECEVDSLPVVDKGKLVGIITRSDILKAFAGVETVTGHGLRGVFAKRSPSASRG
jgi:CBS domain-containing protein/nucleotide-binding universal stress UspA family protein